MNKYFLSLMSILILFQSFRVVDDIFFEEKEFDKAYIVIEEKKELADEIKTKEEDVAKEVNIATLFKNGNLENGKKISKQCSSCHDLSLNLKIKLGPPLWGIVNRDSANISDFKYSEALINFKKNGPLKNFSIFSKIPKNIFLVPRWFIKV